MSTSAVKDLAQSVADAFPNLAKTQQRIALGLYRQLAEGQPVSCNCLAEKLDVAVDLVRDNLSSWPGVYFDEKKNVVGFWGMGLVEMPHRFKVDGRQLYTWCAWDALFIPELLGKTVEVESTCVVSGKTVSMTVGPERVETFSPVSAMVSFMSPTSSFDMNVIASFCHYVLFFDSEEVGKQWVAEHNDTFLLTVEEAHEIGRFTNRSTFGEVLFPTKFGPASESLQAVR